MLFVRQRAVGTGTSEVVVVVVDLVVVVVVVGLPGAETDGRVGGEKRLGCGCTAARAEEVKAKMIAEVSKNFILRLMGWAAAKSECGSCKSWLDQRVNGVNEYWTGGEKHITERRDSRP